MTFLTVVEWILESPHRDLGLLTLVSTGEPAPLPELPVCTGDPAPAVPTIYLEETPLLTQKPASLESLDSNWLLDSIKVFLPWRQGVPQHVELHRG